MFHKRKLTVILLSVTICHVIAEVELKTVKDDQSFIKVELSPDAWQKFPKQEVHLHPGWTGKFYQVSYQIMVQEVGSNFENPRNVRVFPGLSDISDSINSMHAVIFLPDRADDITIYIDQSKPEKEVKKKCPFSSFSINISECYYLGCRISK